MCMRQAVHSFYHSRFDGRTLSSMASVGTDRRASSSRRSSRDSSGRGIDRGRRVGMHHFGFRADWGVPRTRWRSRACVSTRWWSSPVAAVTDDLSSVIEGRWHVDVPVYVMCGSDQGDQQQATIVWGWNLLLAARDMLSSGEFYRSGSIAAVRPESPKNSVPNRHMGLNCPTERCIYPPRAAPLASSSGAMKKICM